MTEQHGKPIVSGPAGNTDGEISLQGRSVSRGAVVGTALCLYGGKRQFYKKEIAGEQVDGEVMRFREAVDASKEQLSTIASDGNGDGNQARIFETHILFLEDRSLLSQIESMISEQRVNAEWAVRTVIDKYASRYKALTDKHLQEKYIDLEDVGERILSSLGTDSENDLSLDSDTVIIAKELNPSTMIELSKRNPAAVVTENGGWTSHTFILARELDLPAVTGIKQLLRSVENGEKIAVDGYEGRVILRPGKETIDNLKSSKHEGINLGDTELDPGARLETLDGQEITVRANLDLSTDYGPAKKVGAKGIGLYRSEFLFNRYRGYPSEEEQFKIYSRIASESDDHGVRIRTFDLSINQVSAGLAGREKNPALGLRGIRLSMRFEAEFRIQVRALLKASSANSISVVLPMISDADEIKWARGVISEERERLLSAGVPCGDPAVGVMVEVPAAVFAIERILDASDFVNIGTNDLVQYLLAVDRDNEEVADWFRTVHSSVIGALGKVLQAANRKGVSALVCGEMAGSPLYTPILLGLGARELSMNVNSVPRISALISRLAIEECEEVLKEIEGLSDGPDRDAEIRRIYQNKWAGLFDFSSLLTFSRR
ncbi:MAG: phosphoenolpyruvate--protein phosphotransferase [Acidobacteria bacterium]|nr:MAG: phosphoenolpyruvate--protein phosphotransferase [Acidobacteriota bacterium]REK01513.1 MAG: phosphoenolpyruvate--protein phosphotransferase [Acidobacteriota bacterium]REK14469.1 MAG: phosphoenolpyruvate--protein phosphotransferase [Acidobacteriota bacterium]REK45184.1 MAG: phosphoenolpyruvate--protein phosphotransferase [Acidobacteriota bacterium]